MKKLLLLSALLIFINSYKIIAQGYNEMSKKDLRVEHFNKLKLIDSLSKELSNKINANGLLKIKVDSLNKQILSLDSHFNKSRVDLQLAIEKLNEMTKNNDSMMNRIKELELEVSNSNKKVSDQQSIINNLQANSIESTFDKDNKEICSLVDRQVKFCSDIFHNKLQYDIDKNYFNTIKGQNELLRLQKEIKIIEKENDKFFKTRGGRTKAEIEFNLELMKSCLKYDKLKEYEIEIYKIIDFVTNQMKID